MTDTEQLYPHADMNIWLRTCEEEIIEPLPGKVTGEIPSWLQGTLLRNGPGANRIGPSRYGHVFDGAALIHRFSINNGEVTYKCRFLCSATYRKNRAANRIVVSEFGTQGVPDPCHTIFDKFASYFSPFERISDNAAVSVYPYGDEIYALSEAPAKYIYRIDPKSLETVDRKTLAHSVLVHHTAHPHVEPNGDVYNVGVYILRGILKHVVVKFPYSKEGDMFKSAEIVGTMRARWTMKPSYMHSFAITENYFVIIEQPIAMNLLNIVNIYLFDTPYSGLINTYPEEETHIVLIHRETGVEKRYRTNTIFFMHTINAYEKDGILVLDLCTYKNSKLIDALYTQAVENMQSNVEYANWFQSRPKRFEIPLNAPDYTKVEPRLLADIGCEIPRINYDYNAKPYKYFYACNLDVDSDLSGTLLKINPDTGEVTSWSEPDCYPSEPIFVPAPDAKEEDDGVVLSVLLRGKDENTAELLVLDASSFKELSRAKFTTPSPVPKCFHGWFLPQRDT